MPEVGRNFNVRCESDNRTTSVAWIRSDTQQPGKYPVWQHCNLSLTLNIHFLNAVSQQTISNIPAERAGELFVNIESETVAILSTVGLGIRTSANGVYSCVVENDLGVNRSESVIITVQGSTKLQVDHQQYCVIMH